MQVVAMLTMSIVGPAVTMYFMRRGYRGALRAHHVEIEQTLNAGKKVLERARRSLEEEQRVHAETRKRAEVAEGIARGQAKHIEALQRSNDTMLTSITDMRRVGFSLPHDMLNAPDPEVISTVGDDDIQAVKDYPHLAAGNDD